ncbi:MAG: DUF2950 domain-containing protein [Gammaproteobacteria bacterium]
MKKHARIQMISLQPSMPCILVLLLMLFAGVAASGTVPATHTLAVQQTFSSPELAMQALVQATQTKNHQAIDRIFGPAADKLLSGDPVADDKHLTDFATGLHESARLQKNGNQYILLVGKNQWPFPVPIVQQGGNWRFDTQAGLEEILNRRIGENELSAIMTCRAYVVAQWQYFTDGDWGHDGVAAYAPKFISSPGQHDGLYWETTAGEPSSPLGTLVAAARAEGYGPQNRPAQATGSKAPHAPYHGYYFRILTRQGLHAPGGKYDYTINGNMIAGFALVAYPDKWGNSGVMTFIVNQQGRVYEKNLGSDTAKIAGAMDAYDPDPSWKLVDWKPDAASARPE